MKFINSTVWTDREQFDWDMRTTIDSLIVFYFLKYHKFQSILEIGFHKGQTASMIIDNSTKDTEIDFVDTNWTNNIIDNLIIDKPNIRKYNCNSKDFSFNKYDFINIDGDHSYEMAKTDIINSANNLNQNGILMIDDIFNAEVDRAIRELVQDKLIIPVLKTNQQIFCCNADKKFPIHNFLLYFVEITTDFMYWTKTESYGKETDELYCSNVFIEKEKVFSALLEEYNL